MFHPRLIFACICLGSFGLCLPGCSADAYRRSADAEVGRILRDRKQRTLAYEPATDVAPGPTSGVPRRAYAAIPATPVPPPIQPPIEPARQEEPAGPLGPELRASPATGEPPPDENAAAPDVLRDDVSYTLGPPVPAELGNRLDLFASLKYATEHAREYSTQTEELYLAALDVTLQRHLFAPRPFARTGLQYTGGQADVNHRSALAATTEAGVRQQLPYGGEVVASTLVQFVDAIHGSSTEGESASVVLTGSVPLLRGAGLVNLEGLIASERELVYRVRLFEDFRRSFAVSVATEYFRLLNLQQSVNNRLENYTDLRGLLERTRALFEAGRISFLEVQRSEQALLSAEALVLESRDAYQSALDDFKVLLGMPVRENLQILPVELEVHVPDVQGDVVGLAEQYRLDLQTARDRMDDARRQAEVARNGLLPDLSLSGQTAVGNRPNTPAKALDERSVTYSAGVNLDLPVDRLAERNVYRRTLIAFDRAQRALQDLRERIGADVRQAVRGIRLAEASLGIQQNSIRLAQRRVDFANELLRKGTASARDVVEAQSSLLTAQDAFEAARSDLQIQVLQFLRDTGTLRVDPEAGAIGRALRRSAEAERVSAQ